MLRLRFLSTRNPHCQYPIFVLCANFVYLSPFGQGDRPMKAALQALSTEVLRLSLVSFFAFTLCFNAQNVVLYIDRNLLWGDSRYAAPEDQVISISEEVAAKIFLFQG